MKEYNKENTLLLDIQYIKPNRKMQLPDYLYIITKNMDTEEKHLEIITEPTIDIFFEKPELRTFSINKNYELMKNLDKKTVKYKDIIYEIANEMGDTGRQKLQQCFTTGNRDGFKEFYMYPYVFGADFDIRAWYRHQWLLHYDNDRPKIVSKGFMDIEVDTLESVGMPDPMFNPIDLITLIDCQTKQSYTFSLIGVDCVEKDTTLMDSFHKKKEMKRRDLYRKRMISQIEVSSDIDSLREKAEEIFNEKYDGMKYNFYFYKDEKKMLVHFFQLVNKLKLDFIGVWNISFDIPYIMERLKSFGMDPRDVICHPDFPVKECWFKRDTKMFQVKNKSDFFHCSSYTIFYDQMIAYAAIRKGQSELRSNKLTSVADVEIADKKLDYSEDGNIKTISYNNFFMYIMYNIKDVLLQCGIEEKTDDLATYYFTSYKNMTPYESEFKQTVKLRNVQYKSFYRQNIIPGNNINALLYNYEEKEKEDDDDEDDKFEGALVGNPLLIEHFGEEMFGKRSNAVFTSSIDFDMSAFYPSTIGAMNIDASTLIFKVIVDPTQYDVRGGKIRFNGMTDTQVVRSNKDSFLDDVGKEIFDNFQTGNWLTTGNKWMDLPSIEEMYEVLEERLGE